jgi:hypothetical protein
MRPLPPAAKFDLQLRSNSKDKQKKRRSPEQFPAIRSAAL